MARYVVQIASIAAKGTDATVLRTEQDAYLNLKTPLQRILSLGTGTEVVSRTEWATQAEADAHYADQLAKQTSGLNQGLYLKDSSVDKHVCRHDEGIGFCTLDAETVK